MGEPQSLAVRAAFSFRSGSSIVTFALIVHLSAFDQRILTSVVRDEDSHRSEREDGRSPRECDFSFGGTAAWPARCEQAIPLDGASRPPVACGRPQSGSRSPGEVVRVPEAVANET